MTSVVKSVQVTFLCFFVLRGVYSKVESLSEDVVANAIDVDQSQNGRLLGDPAEQRFFFNLFKTTTKRPHHGYQTWGSNHGKRRPNQHWDNKGNNQYGKRPQTNNHGNSNRYRWPNTGGGHGNKGNYGGNRGKGSHGNNGNQYKGGRPCGNRCATNVVWEPFSGYKDNANNFNQGYKGGNNYGSQGNKGQNNNYGNQRPHNTGGYGNNRPSWETNFGQHTQYGSSGNSANNFGNQQYNSQNSGSYSTNFQNHGSQGSNTQAVSQSNRLPTFESLSGGQPQTVQGTRPITIVSGTQNKPFGTGSQISSFGSFNSGDQNNKPFSTGSQGSSFESFNSGTQGNKPFGTGSQGFSFGSFNTGAQNNKPFGTGSQDSSFGSFHTGAQNNKPFGTGSQGSSFGSSNTGAQSNKPFGTGSQGSSFGSFSSGNQNNKPFGTSSSFGSFSSGSQSNQGARPITFISGTFQENPSSASSGQGSVRPIFATSSNTQNNGFQSSGSSFDNQIGQSQNSISTSNGVTTHSNQFPIPQLSFTTTKRPSTTEEDFVRIPQRPQSFRRSPSQDLRPSSSAQNGHITPDQKWSYQLWSQIYGKNKGSASSATGSNSGSSNFVTSNNNLPRPIVSSLSQVKLPNNDLTTSFSTQPGLKAAFFPASAVNLFKKTVIADVKEVSQQNATEVNNTARSVSGTIQAQQNRKANDLTVQPSFQSGSASKPPPNVFHFPFGRVQETSKPNGARPVSITGSSIRVTDSNELGSRFNFPSRTSNTKNVRTVARPGFVEQIILDKPKLLPRNETIEEFFTKQIAQANQKVKTRTARDLDVLSAAKRLNADMLFKLSPLEDLPETIVKGLSSFTLLLPTNDAFSRLPPSLLKKWQENPEQFIRLAMNHVIDVNRALAFDALSDNVDKVESRANNGVIHIKKYKESLIANGRKIIKSDELIGTNGVIHIIDGILFPVAQSSLMDVISSCEQLENFRFSMVTAGLSDNIKTGGPYTIFVPINSAFDALSFETKQLLASNSSAMKDVLMYHIVDGIHFSETLTDGQYLTSLDQDNPIRVGIRSGERKRILEANLANVLNPDLSSRNGVIHVVDKVMTPNDIQLCSNNDIF